jgi:hypothetical protein
MSSPLQSKILKALFVAMKPISRTLLRAGVGYREFSDIAKAAFIDEATAEYGLRGRPTNISRVAIMTGISRKEIGRIRSAGLNRLVDYTVNISPGALVLQHWHTDSEFTDQEGLPLSLDFDGRDISFVSLVRKYAGDIPAGAMRTELKRMGAIEEFADRKLKVLKREFVPSGLDDRLALGLDSIIHSAAETLAYNCDPENKNDLSFQQIWGVSTINPDRFPEVKKVARERLTEFGRSFDDYLSTLEQPAGDENIPSREVGVGLYYYELPYNDGK